MGIEIRGHGLRLTRASRRHIGRRLRHALRSISDYVDQVTVVVIRESGQTSNADYRCEIMVRAAATDLLHVIERDATVYAAFGKAIQLVQAAVTQVQETQEPSSCVELSVA